MSHLAEVSGKQFETEVVKAEQPVLVDFWSPTCMPCRMLAPILEEVAQELAGRVKVVKVNVADNMPLAISEGIMGVPTLKLYDGGKVVGEQVGLLPKGALMDFINQHVPVPVAG